MIDMVQLIKFTDLVKLRSSRIWSTLRQIQSIQSLELRDFRCLIGQSNYSRD